MPYVIAAGCVKDGACLDTCVTESIERGTYTAADGTVYDQMFINPESCIDCGNCESACEQQCIFADADLPADQAQYEEINRSYFEKKA